MIAIIVCGGRRYNNWPFFEAAMDEAQKLIGFTRVVHGGADGADTMAGKWAEERGFRVTVFEAAWDAYGRAAGAIRNQVMLEHGDADALIFFPGGRGTMDMVTRARRADLAVYDAKDLYPPKA